MIDLHKEDRAIYPYSDALCSALQILNHLQDAGDDYAQLERVYIPDDAMAAAGIGAEELRAQALSPAMRGVYDHLLAGVDGLVAEAKRLPGGVRNRRFAMECATIVGLAERLTAKLKREDPLAGGARLSKLDFASAGLSGVLSGLFGARPAKSSVSGAAA